MFVVVGEGRMSARGKISSKTGDRKGRGRKRRSFFTERAHRPKRETMTDSKPKYRAGRLLALQLSRRGMTGCLLCDGAVERLLSVRFAAGKGLAEALREASDMGRLPEPVGDRTEISLDTDRVCLVPAELFDPSDAGSYLDVHGVSFDDADEVLVSSEVAGAIALMACEGEVCALFAPALRRGGVHASAARRASRRARRRGDRGRPFARYGSFGGLCVGIALCRDAAVPDRSRSALSAGERPTDVSRPDVPRSAVGRAARRTGPLPRAAFPPRRGRQAHASRLGRT